MKVRFTLLFLLLGRLIVGQTKADLLDSTCQKNLDKNFYGCILAYKQGSTIFSKCYGYGNQEAGELLTDTTLFELASNSKQFTAFAALLLIDRDSIKYNTKVIDLIPDFPYADVTIYHLLTHTSGIPDYLDMLYKYCDKNIPTNDDLLNAFIIYRPEPEFKAGTKFNYSNSGYAILASIIEKCSGQKYSEFLNDHIFAPLGMTHTGVVNRRYDSTHVKNFALGYRWNAEEKKFSLPDCGQENTEMWLAGIVGDGAINSCTKDLLIWHQALQRHVFLKQKTYDKMYSKGKLSSGESFNYGFGVDITEANEEHKIVQQHPGGWPGYKTYTVRLIDDDTIVILLSNNDSYGTDGPAIIVRALEILK